MDENLLELIKTVARIEAKLEVIDEIKQDIKDLKDANLHVRETLGKDIEYKCDDCEPMKMITTHIEDAKEASKSTWNWSQFIVTTLISLGTLMVLLLKRGK